MARVYLETSFFSACVTDRSDARSLYRREASIEWWQKQRTVHELFISAEVLTELRAPGYRRSGEAVELARGIPLLDVTEEVYGLAQILVDDLTMPQPAWKGDAVHIAAAIFHRMQYVLTWNVRHLANPNKVEHLRRISVRFGLLPPAIVTPEFLWEATDERGSETQ